MLFSDQGAAEVERLGQVLRGASCTTLIAAAFHDAGDLAAAMTAKAATLGLPTTRVQVRGGQFRDLAEPDPWWDDTLVAATRDHSYRPRLGQPIHAPATVAWLPNVPSLLRDAVHVHAERLHHHQADAGTLGARALSVWRRVVSGDERLRDPADVALLHVAVQRPAVRDAMLLALLPDVGDIPDRLAGVSDRRYPRAAAQTAHLANPVLTGRWQGLDSGRYARATQVLGVVAATMDEGTQAPALAAAGSCAMAAADLPAAWRWTSAAIGDDANFEYGRRLHTALKPRHEAAPYQAAPAAPRQPRLPYPASRFQREACAKSQRPRRRTSAVAPQDRVWHDRPAYIHACCFVTRRDTWQRQPVRVRQDHTPPLGRGRADFRTHHLASACRPRPGLSIAE